MQMWTASDFAAFDTLVSLGTAVEEHGLEMPSLRTIARYANCSAGTLINWFGSKSELRRRTLIALGVKWGHILTTSLIPADPEARCYARLRLTYQEMARTDAAVAHLLGDLEQFERDIIVWWLQDSHRVTRVDPHTLTVLHALLLRLWDERAHPDDQASRLLLNHMIDACLGPPAVEGAYLRAR